MKRETKQNRSMKLAQKIWQHLITLPVEDKEGRAFWAEQLDAVTTQNKGERQVLVSAEEA